MGTSGVILKKKETSDICKLIHDVKLVAKRGGYIPYVESQLFDCKWQQGVEYTTGSVVDIYEDEFVLDSQQQWWFMYIYSDGFDDFEWLIKGENLFRAVVIEDLSNCSKMLLDFLYEFFKIYPDDYFWSERKWYYTYEDIVKIKQEDFDRYWYCKNPHID